jgi:hypothetical protein
MRMGTRMRRTADVGPFIGAVHKFQRALAERADALLVWREGPRHGLVADIPEGKLLLTPFSAFWMLTLIYEVPAPVSEDGTASGKVELGRRRIDVGSPLRLQRVAIELAQRGVPGGPTESRCPDGQWIPGTRRMVLPTGQLRLSDTVGPCMLTFENDDGVELLGVGSCDEMAKHALTRWDQRVARPLRLVVEGQVVKLRSIDVPGVLGYHALTENCFIALVHEKHDLALVLIEGIYAYLLARVSWDDAIHGEAFDVDALMDTRSAAHHGSSASEADVREEARKPPYPATVASLVTSSVPDVAREVPQSGAVRASCPPGYTAMSEYNRALCRWYLEWLHGRLRGRGARKARALVLLILEAIDRCRVDLTGTRAEVHAALVQILGAPPLKGEDRNIRDALDLLASQSLFARRAGTQCTLVLSQFHDLNSPLMRRIAAEKAAAEGGVGENVDDSAVIGTRSESTVDAASDATATGNASSPEEPVVTVHETAKEEASLPSVESDAEGPTTSETAEVPPKVVETSRVIEPDCARPEPARSARGSSALEGIEAFMATPRASGCPNLSPAANAGTNSIAMTRSSAPMNLPSSAEAGRKPTPGDEVMPPAERPTSIEPAALNEDIEPRMCPITWSAFASGEVISSQMGAPPTSPEQSKGSKPDVSLRGFTRRPSPQDH